MNIHNRTWFRRHGVTGLVAAGITLGAVSIGAQEMSVMVSRQGSGNAAGMAVAQTESRWSLPAFWTEEPSAGAYALVSWLEHLDRLRDGLRSNNGFIGTDDEATIAMLFNRGYGESLLLRKMSSDPVQARGEIPDTFYTILDAKVDALQEEIVRLAPGYSLPTGEKCGDGLGGVISEAVRETQPDAVVVDAILSGEKWAFRVNELGIPKARVRRGYVLYKVPGQDLTVCRQMTIQQPYFASDDAWSTYTIRLGDLRLQ